MINLHALSAMNRHPLEPAPWEIDDPCCASCGWGTRETERCVLCACEEHPAGIRGARVLLPALDYAMALRRRQHGIDWRCMMAKELTCKDVGCDCVSKLRTFQPIQPQQPSRRDILAGMALQRLLSRDDTADGATADEIAAEAVTFADLLIAALDAPREEK